MHGLNKALERITLDQVQLQAAGKRRYRAVFVQAGKARAAGNRLSDIEVSETALQFACQRGLFDGRAVFIDHAGLDGSPSLKNLIGVTAAASYDPQSKAVVGEIILYQGA